MSAAATRPFVVLKFGGTSVSTRDRWETIGRIARERWEQGFKPVVVCSAVSGVTNLLEEIVAGAPHGRHEVAYEQIVTKHRDLAATLGLDVDAVLGELLGELERVARGAALLGETSPRTHARILALGELMSTTLGAAFLTAQGQPTRWLDARTALAAIPDPHGGLRRNYLSAACDYTPSADLQASLAADPAELVLTQGFIAHNDDAETVLLGRGGSDTSAAYLAARLSAARCEIWTDVPGMFTADPRQVPVARHLRNVDYDEAQEIATTGAKVLHPRCIGPCREYGIPMEIRSTPNPEIEGTCIESTAGDAAPGVKAISWKKGITLISMDSVGMWQQVGFLADIFACFKKNGLSVDQVSTSETNVTVSLDPTANTLTGEAVDALLEDLSEHCRARAISNCAAVSLVGQGIRSILHRLGPALALFEEQQIHLVSQAASDLNLTVIVDEAQASRLVRRLHEILFDTVREGRVFGRTWEELHGASRPVEGVRRWWHERREELLAIDAGSVPVYVYDVATILERARSLTSMAAVDRVFYAVKANTNADILRLLEAEGIGFEVVSPGEVRRVLEACPGLDRKRVLFTPNFASIREYAEAFELGIHVNLDNLHPLREHGEVFRGRSIMVRVDPGRGRGHHDHVRTAGRGSKFGVDADEMAELRELAAQHDVRIVGLHAHAGSGILTPEHWREVAAVLTSWLPDFPDVRRLDLGGGLGVVERASQEPLDISGLDASLAEIRQAHPTLELWLEPGRYLVAEAGVLLASVTQTKEKGDVRYVGINAGMHTLLRPALYGAYHGIVNLTRFDAPRTILANVVGPICETGDTLGFNRRLPETREGDTVLIDTAGAYGYTMSSDYNLRGRAREVLLPPRG